MYQKKPANSSGILDYLNKLNDLESSSLFNAHLLTILLNFTRLRLNISDSSPPPLQHSPKGEPKLTVAGRVEEEVEAEIHIR